MSNPAAALVTKIARSTGCSQWCLRYRQFSRQIAWTTLFTRLIMFESRVHYLHHLSRVGVSFPVHDFQPESEAVSRNGVLYVQPGRDHRPGSRHRLPLWANLTLVDRSGYDLFTQSSGGCSVTAQFGFLVNFYQFSVCRDRYRGVSRRYVYSPVWGFLRRLLRFWPVT